MNDAPWPQPMSDAAFHGVAGDFVRTVGPQTEADPAALLSQLLIAFGVAAGRHRYVAVEASRHYPNENMLLVGQSAKARKGVAFAHVSNLIAAVDNDFIEHRVVSGLSSGEGLIAQVQDPEELEDRFDHDQRLLCVSSEFAQTIRVLAREGNTLSAVIRDAWDSRRLQILVRNQPIAATGAHISLIGHITREELLDKLDKTELMNGFFNRFMVFAVERARLLPFGGQLDGRDLARVQGELAGALSLAAVDAEVKFSPAAADLYTAVYGSLSEARPGVLGAATARAEAHVLRLSLIYALLDCHETIGQAHLEAALEVWRFSNDSARWVFGETSGDPLADAILLAVNESPKPLTRTELSARFSRNRGATELNRAVTKLLKSGSILMTKEVDGMGPPVTRYAPAGKL